MTIKNMPNKNCLLLYKNNSGKSVKSEVNNLAFSKSMPNILKNGKRNNENNGVFKKLSQSNRFNVPWLIKFLIWMVFKPSSIHAPRLPVEIEISESAFRNGICDKSNKATSIKNKVFIAEISFKLVSKSLIFNIKDFKQL